MSILRKAINQTAYMKAGIMGFAGSGKTFTAAQIALGLSRHVGDGKPVAFFDTETGSDFLIPRFKTAGIELLVAKTRSFADLKTFMREAEKECSVAILDSITHVWSELLAAYKKKRNRSKLQFQDWDPIKTEWAEFTTLYLNTKLHVIMCGRAGWEYEFEKDSDGNKELVKTGTKMKAESEMGYEPSLLIEMLRLKKSEMTGDSNAKGWINRAVVLKDRCDIMNGSEIDSPNFESFRPIVEFLNIGGEHVGVDTTRSSESLFDSGEGRNERKLQMEIVLELILDAFVAAGSGGSSGKAKETQVAKLTECFGTSSWAAIKAMRLEALQAGLVQLKVALGLEEAKPEPTAAQMDAVLVDTADGLKF